MGRHAMLTCHVDMPCWHHIIWHHIIWHLVRGWHFTEALELEKLGFSQEQLQLVGASQGHLRRGGEQDFLEAKQDCRNCGTPSSDMLDLKFHKGSSCETVYNCIGCQHCNILQLTGIACWLHKDLRLYRPHHQAGQAAALGQANWAQHSKMPSSWRTPSDDRLIGHRRHRTRLHWLRWVILSNATNTRNHPMVYRT